MKRFKFTKKRVLTVLSIAGVLAVAGVAYGYFTASGSGTGSASVGNASGITLSGTITGTLYPAGDPASVSVDVTNPGSASQHVGSVKLDSITTDADHSTCDVSVGGTNPAFTMANIPVNQTLAAGDTTTVSGSLQMNDTGASQNDCQGAALTLHFSSN
jgi:hypothetical protein